MTVKIISNRDPIIEMQALQKTATIPGMTGNLASIGDAQDDALVVCGTREEPLIRRVGLGQTLLSGKDRRSVVQVPAALPWRMICALEITGSGGAYIGTGWIAGPRLVMTAGHCVHGTTLGGWAQSICVRPGRSEESTGPEYLSTSFKASKQWVIHADENHDYGAIILDEDIGDDFGIFSSASYPDHFLKNRLLNISGYPASRVGEIQMHHENRVNDLSSTKIYYDIDTEGGQSGSPIWLYEDADKKSTNPIVVGIHAYGAGNAAVGNSGVRMTEDVLDFIRSHIS